MYGCGCAGVPVRTVCCEKSDNSVKYVGAMSCSLLEYRRLRKSMYVVIT